MKSPHGIAIFGLAVMLGACSAGEETDKASTDSTAADSVENAAAIDTFKEEVNSEPPAPGQPTLAEQKQQLAKIVNSKNPFGVDTVRVVFKQTGLATGTYTLYVEAFGERAASVEEVEYLGDAVNTVRYWDGLLSHTLAGDAIEVSTTPLRFGNLEPSVLARFSEEEIAEKGFEDGGMAEAAGKPCHVWRSKLMAQEVCLWNGIELISRKNKQADGSYAVNQVAVSVEEGIAIPGDIKALAEAADGK